MHRKRMFGEFDIPQIVITHNGPEFKVNEIKIFAKEWYFQHDISSAHYTEANDLVEC